MQRNDNKALCAAAIWENPGRLFGCDFRTKGRFQENRKGGDYIEDGKIRLLLTQSEENIMVFYNGSSRDAKTDIFTHAQRYILHTADFFGTLREIAKIYGIELSLSDEEKRKIGKAALIREISLSFVEALRLNPKGEAARYLKDVRGMEPDGVHFGELSADSLNRAKESLKNRGIAYSEADFEELGLTAKTIANGFCLYIPAFENGICKGFTLRNTGNNGRGKYYCAPGVEKVAGCDRLESGAPCYVVEGCFDALRLAQAGLQNVIQMGGASASRVFQLIHDNGISDVTYIPDIEFDEQGRQKKKIINDNIKAFLSAEADGEKVVKNFYLGLLPVPAGSSLSGYKADADSYGKENGLEALRHAAEDDKISWWAWKVEGLIEAAQEREKEAANGEFPVSWFQREFDGIYSAVASPYERERLRQFVTESRFSVVFEAAGITARTLTEIDEMRRARLKADRLKDAAAALSEGVANGSSAKIAAAIASLNDIQGTDSRAEWNRQLQESFDDELRQIREQRDALKTGWELGGIIQGSFHRFGNVEFYPADIAVICAASSHGKTTFLVQSALDMVKQYQNKTFLYVSIEENKRQLVERFINAYISTPTTADGHTPDINIPGGYCFKTGTRKRTIKAILRGDNAPEDYAPLMGYSEHFESLKKQVQAELSRYAKEIRPRLKIVNAESTTESICSNIRYFLDECAEKGIEVGGVFVDYIQLLTAEEKTYSRTDELKAICKTLKVCAQQAEIPFVIAAQLNRNANTEGIDAVTMSNLGESTDIERIAHDIYFVWQIDKTKIDLYTKPKMEGKGADRKPQLDADGYPVTEFDFTKMGTRARRIFKRPESERPANFEESGRGVTLKAGYLYVENLKARDGRSGGWGLLKWDGESGKVYGNDIQAMKE